MMSFPRFILMGICWKLDLPRCTILRSVPRLVSSEQRRQTGCSPLDRTKITSWHSQETYVVSSAAVIWFWFWHTQCCDWGSQWSIFKQYCALPSLQDPLENRSLVLGGRLHTLDTWHMTCLSGYAEFPSLLSNRILRQSNDWIGSGYQIHQSKSWNCEESG